MGLIGDVVNLFTSKKTAETQVAASNQALQYQKDLQNYAKELNQPHMVMGNNALRELEMAIKFGGLKGDSKALDAFKPANYVADKYTSQFQKMGPGEAFTSEMADFTGPTPYQGKGFVDMGPGEAYKSKLDQFTGPGAYQSTGYMDMAPSERFRSDFENMAPSERFQSEFQDYTGPDRYQSQFQDFKPTGPYESQFRNFQYGEDRPQVARFERGDAPTYQGYEFREGPSAYQDERFTGQQYMTGYDQFEGEGRPEERRISSEFDTATYQDERARPGVYVAQDAPDAEYYTPPNERSEVYSAERFNVQDDPGYQRRYDKAMKAIEASAAAQGMQLSGATLKALQEEAANIASEETEAAYKRYADERGFEAGQDEQQYARDVQRQREVKDAMQFQSADQYKRYLDNVGIRGGEQERRVQNWEQDRAFGADQNKEIFLREQAGKAVGRELNQDEFNRWLQTDGQKYQQFANTRDWATEQSNLNASRDWQQYAFEKGFSRDLFRDDRDYILQSDMDKARIGLDEARLRQDQYQTGTEMDYRSAQDYQTALRDAFEKDRGYSTDLASEQDLRDYEQSRDYRDYMTDLSKFKEQTGFQQHESERDFQRDLATDKDKMAYDRYQDYRDYETNLKSVQDDKSFQRYQDYRDYETDLAKDKELLGVDLFKSQRDYDTDLALTKDERAFDRYQDFRDYSTGLKKDQELMGIDLYRDQRDYDTDLGFMKDDRAFDRYQDIRDYNTGLAQTQDQMGFDQYSNMRDYYAGQQNQINKQNYGLLLDRYNRDLADSQAYYGQLRDLVGIGLGAKSSALGQAQNYAGTAGNLAISQGDIKASGIKSATDSVATGFDPIGEKIF